MKDHWNYLLYRLFLMRFSKSAHRSWFRAKLIAKSNISISEDPLSSYSTPPLVLRISPKINI